MSACSIGVNVRSGACTPDDPPSIDVTQARAADIGNWMTPFGAVSLKAHSTIAVACGKRDAYSS